MCALLTPSSKQPSAGAYFLFAWRTFWVQNGRVQAPAFCLPVGRFGSKTTERRRLLFCFPVERFGFDMVRFLGV